MPELKTKNITNTATVTEAPFSQKSTKQKSVNEIENLKLWLGINSIDTVANIGTIPFLIGYFMNINFVVTLLLFLITFFSYAYTVIMYFTHYNEKYSRTHWEWNKWITLIVTVFVTGLMVAVINTKYDAQYNNTDCRDYRTTNCTIK